MAKVTARNLDFSGVKEGGQFNKKRIPAGDYLAKIVKVEDAVSKGDEKNPMYLFSIKILKYPASVLPYYCVLNKENQLWKLRNIMIAAGKNVPKAKIKVDPNLIVGKTIGVTIEDSEYDKDGKTIDQSEVDGVFPASELADQPGATEEVLDDSDEAADDDDADDEDLSMVAASADDDEADEADEAEDEPEEEEAPADPYADLDRASLKRELKKLDPNFKAKTSQTDDDLRAMLAAANGDIDEDEAEEEEPEPAPKARKKAARPKAEEVSDEELDALDIDSI